MQFLLPLGEKVRMRGKQEQKFMDGKILIDNIPQINSLDLLQKIDSFYNNAWLKLTIFVTIVIAIAGIFIPIIINFFIQWYQKRFFVLEENKIKFELKNEITTLIDEKLKM